MVTPFQDGTFRVEPKPLFITEIHESRAAKGEHVE